RVDLLGAKGFDVLRQADLSQPTCNVRGSLSPLIQCLAPQDFRVCVAVGSTGSVRAFADQVGSSLPRRQEPSALAETHHTPKTTVSFVDAGTCSGHPRRLARCEPEAVDGRVEPGQDDSVNHAFETER